MFGDKSRVQYIQPEVLGSHDPNCVTTRQLSCGAPSDGNNRKTAIRRVQSSRKRLKPRNGSGCSVSSTGLAVPLSCHGYFEALLSYLGPRYDECLREYVRIRQKTRISTGKKQEAAKYGGIKQLVSSRRRYVHPSPMAVECNNGGRNTRKTTHSCI